MENISPEIIERMDGQINAWKSLGHVVDARLLHVSELELVEIRVLDNSPTVVLQFASQLRSRRKDERNHRRSQRRHSIRALSVGDAVIRRGVSNRRREDV